MIYSLGADPEFFIGNKNGDLVSSIGIVGGSKHAPKPLDDHGQFRVQEDNVAVEYNIPPAYTRERWVEYIHFGQELIAKMLGAHNVKIFNVASAIFPDKELSNPKAKEFGCDPDFNAWTLDINPKPAATNANLRSAGGHVHIGIQDLDTDRMTQIIRNADKWLGVWSVIKDPDNTRRQLYGKAGAFRPQPHGIEYRTMSNFWIFDKELTGEVWDRTQHAANSEEILLADSIEGMEIQRIINEGDKKAALAFCKQYGVL